MLLDQDRLDARLCELYQTPSLSHSMLAEAFRDALRQPLIYTSNPRYNDPRDPYQPREAWYTYEDHRWQPVREEEILNTIRGRSRAVWDPEQAAHPHRRQPPFTDSRDLPHLLSSLKAILADPQRGQQWNWDLDLLGTPDGVYDLRRGQLRAGTPEDEVSFCTGGRVLRSDDPRVEEARDYFRWLCPDPSLRYQVLEVLANTLDGGASGRVPVRHLLLGLDVDRAEDLFDHLREALGDYADADEIAQRQWWDVGSLGPEPGAERSDPKTLYQWLRDRPTLEYRTAVPNLMGVRLWTVIETPTTRRPLLPPSGCVLTVGRTSLGRGPRRLHPLQWPADTPSDDHPGPGEGLLTLLLQVYRDTRPPTV